MISSAEQAHALLTDGITPQHIADELLHRFLYRHGCDDSRLAGYTSQELVEIGMAWPGKSGMFASESDRPELYKMMLLLQPHKMRAVEEALKKHFGMSIARRVQEDIDRIYVTLVPEDTRYSLEREADRKRYNELYTKEGIPRYSLCMVVRNGKMKYFKSHENPHAYDYALVMAQYHPGKFKAGYKDYLGLAPVKKEEYDCILASGENNSHIQDVLIIDLDVGIFRFRYSFSDSGYECTLAEAAVTARNLFNNPDWQRNEQRFHRVFMGKDKVEWIVQKEDGNDDKQAVS